MVIDRKACEIWKNSNIWTCSVSSKIFRKITSIRTPHEELVVFTCILYHYRLFSAPQKWKISMLDKIIKIDFKQNLSVRSVDYIIFFSFPNLLYLYNTSATIFSGSRTALKIDNFRLYVHTPIKRGVLHEEFLQNYFFEKFTSFWTFSYHVGENLA